MVRSTGNLSSVHNSGKNSYVVRRGNMDGADSTRREIGFRRNVNDVMDVWSYTG